MTRVALCLIAALVACSTDDSNNVRGRGMTVTSLSSTEQAHVYEAAARAAFNVDDPSLSLMVDARLLPRMKGLEPNGRLADPVVSELRRRGAAKGTCEPALQGTRGTARCETALPGYVLRFSPVFSLGADSTQVYVYAQRYDTPTSGISETLRFERAYQVVRHGDAWVAVREGQVPRDVRGDKK